MKNLIVAILIVLVCATGSLAFTWQSANQATVSWNATTTLEDGSPISEENVIKYYLYRKVEGGEKERVGVTADLQFTFTFVTEGRYIVGISSARFVDDELVGESEINWSDTNGESTPNPFGFTYYSRPSAVKGVRIQ